MFTEADIAPCRMYEEHICERGGYLCDYCRDGTEVDALRVIHTPEGNIMPPGWLNVHHEHGDDGRVCYGGQSFCSIGCLGSWAASSPEVCWAPQ